MSTLLGMLAIIGIVTVIVLTYVSANIIYNKKEA
jgi:hypothetical protein